MTVDVVCGGPVFLDLTFEGLEALPGPGQERYARDLHATPGGAAITAIGLVRLGLRAAVAWPLGRDVPGAMLRSLLERERIVCAGPETERTPVTVVLPVEDDRAFATFEPGARVERALVERLAPRAVVTGMDQLHVVPVRAAAYVVVDDERADRYALRPPDAIAGTRALVANRSEALRLTGEATPDGAALALAERVETAVVTCGAKGAVACSNGELVRAAAPPVETRDTTGAGDLFLAAYVWGDLNGLPLAERIRRAVVYAALSVRTATGAAGAATLAELEAALAELDPTIVHEQSAKENL
ncbi:MAG: PfkB family carbohydrate kinase [Actinomycetota bacterium]|nr:PfkB family carbohydrate kinase [Actinomycetota bacterium]